MNIDQARPSTRRYRMTARAKQTETTVSAILAAAKIFFEQKRFADITLAQVAKHAGVSEQTVIRHFKNKEGLFEALVEQELPRVIARRKPANGANCSASEAIHTLVQHYQEDGQTMLRFLNQEHHSSAIDALLTQARDAHEQWVKHYFSGTIGSSLDPNFTQRLNGVIAITDLSTWKLLHVDRGLSSCEVEQTMLLLLRGLNPTMP